MDVSSMDPPPSTHVQVNSVALHDSTHDSRQSLFRSIALAPSSEWARQSKAEADARKKAKGAMISGFANMFKL